MSQRRLDSTRGRLELAAAGAVALLFTLVPWAVDELFPFSRATMFAFPLEQLAIYEVVDPDGEALPPLQFGLQVNNRHDPPVRSLGRFGFGRRRPATLQQGDLAPYGTIHDRSRVTGQVERVLAGSGLPWVDVTRRVVGRRPDGSVGEIDAVTWRVDNPGPQP